MKEYPCDVSDLIDLDNGCQLGYFSKGHHDFETFAAGVVWSYGVSIVPEQGQFKHVWYRCVPLISEWDGKYDGGVMFVAARPGRRGAFPLTVFEIAGGGGGDVMSTYFVRKGIFYSDPYRLVRRVVEQFSPEGFPLVFRLEALPGSYDSFDEAQSVVNQLTKNTPGDGITGRGRG